jgi:hypothetical protein
MFCTARQTSQGTQRIYTASNTDDIINNNMNNNFNTFGTHRNNHEDNARANLNFMENNDDEMIQHELSSFDDAPYMTPQATQVMRFVSLSINLKESEDDTDYDATEVIN